MIVTGLKISTLTFAMLMSMGAQAITTDGVIATRTGTTCAIKPNGTSYCWGNSASCQVVTCNLAIQTTPWAMLANTTMLTMFDNGVCAVVSGGVRCWGANNWGQGGQLSKTPAAWPEFPKDPTHYVDGLSSGVTHIDGGTGHVCAVQNGAARCWGLNTAGQLGDGSTVSTNTPVTPNGLTTGVLQVATSGATSCAVMTGGSVKCWGYYHGNSSPPLGTIVAVPTLVTALTSGVTDIDAGDNHICVLQNGAVKCWGSNTFGQFGRGNFSGDSATPQSAAGQMTLGVGMIYAGHNETCGVKAGLAYCWGLNAGGQIGDGTTTNRNLPTWISSLTSVTSMAVGTHNACSQSSGGYRCWGDNTFEQIDGPAANPQTTPYLFPF